MDETTLRRRIGVSALIVSGGVLLSRILGVFRESFFAGMLGADGTTDQYVAAFRIPDFLNYLLAGGFLAITFIPIFARYLADDDEQGGWAAFNAILWPLTAAMVGLVVIGMVAAPTVVEWLYPDFTAEQISETVLYTRIVLPAQVFFVAGALLTAVQYSKGQFVIPTLAPIIYNLGIIGGGLLHAVIWEPSPVGFVWGVLVGAVIGNFGVQWLGARRAGMQVARPVTLTHPVMREYFAIAIPLMIGQSIVVLDETFMSVFGDRVGDGAQTHLQFARRTMFVPIGVIAQAAGVAAYPALARLFAAGKKQAMADTVDKTVGYVLALSMAAAALLAALSIPVVRVLFERVRFTPEDTTATASALFFYALAIPIWGVLQIVTRAFYARRQMLTPVAVGTGATVVAVPLYIALEASLGLRGVA
ncbi:MAG: murein biosynthesis integral membrane protein MurJ, partial [Acidimicrobiia bacterium]|nr:murein biosynthesis integral membrane protein MurJ [Acidimicrobiia bacterium]